MTLAVQRFTPVVGDDHNVFDPSAPIAVEIDPGFDTEGHARTENEAVPGNDVGLFVDRQPDSVARAVDEPVGQSGCGEPVAGGRVDRLGGNPGTGGGDRSFLGRLQLRIGAGDLGTRLGEAVGAGAVRVVTGVNRTADIDDDDVVIGDDALGMLVVRIGAVRSGSDDDEGGGGVSLGGPGAATQPSGRGPGRLPCRRGAAPLSRRHP